MQINFGKGSLETLEQDLLPVAIGNPQKTIYRRLLVELYGAMAFPLIQQVRHGEPSEVEKARGALRTIGTRAMKPLLDALVDEKEAQQRIAVDLLAFVENKSAGPALYAFATSQAEQPLRVQAMVAAGALRDPALLARFEAFYFPRGTKGSRRAIRCHWLRRGAWRGWETKEARPFCSSCCAEVRPICGPWPPSGSASRTIRSTSPSSHNSHARSRRATSRGAAAAFALGELGASDATGTLLTLAQGSDMLAATSGTLGARALAEETPPPRPSPTVFSRAIPRCARARCSRRWSSRPINIEARATPCRSPTVPST